MNKRDYIIEHDKKIYELSNIKSKEDAIKILFDEPLIDLNTGKRHMISNYLKMVSQDDYEKIIDKIATLRLRKVFQSGESFYKENDLETILWGVYSDLRRKFVRLLPLLRIALDDKIKLVDNDIGDNITKNALIKFNNECKDIANYGIMGVQLTNKFINKIEDDEDE